MYPPLAASIGGWGTKAMPSRSVSAACPPRTGSNALSNWGRCSFRSSSALSPAAQISPSRSCARSLGPPRPATSRPKARDRSYDARSVTRTISRWFWSSKKCPTNCNRDSIFARSVSGAETSPASNRRPAAVTQRSTSPSKLPFTSPDADRQISRLSRVAGSIATCPPRAIRRGAERYCPASFWVASR